ncbi:MAG: DMT family transporter [Anaerolineales bacterium]
MRTSRDLYPYLALLAGIVSLGFSALFVRWAHAPGAVTAMYRTGIATIVLTPFFLRRRPPTLAHLGYPIAGGLLTAFDLALWNAGINRTAAGTATLLGNTAPLWVALYAWLFFREKLNRRFWLGLVLALSGSIVVLGSDYLRHPTFGLGDLMALSAGLFYAGYYLVTQRGREHLDTLAYMWWMGLTCTLALTAINIGLKSSLVDYPPASFLAFLGAGLITQLGGYFTIGYALGHLPASLVAPTMIAQPILTTLLAIPFLGEIPHPVQWGGTFTVLAGIYLVHRSRTPGG